MNPIPYWRADRDYYAKDHPLRAHHIREIEAGERIDSRIAASSGDGSYCVTVTAKEIVRC